MSVSKFLVFLIDKAIKKDDSDGWFDWKWNPYGVFASLVWTWLTSCAGWTFFLAQMRTVLWLPAISRWMTHTAYNACNCWAGNVWVIWFIVSFLIYKHLSVVCIRNSEFKSLKYWSRWSPIMFDFVKLVTLSLPVCIDIREFLSLPKFQGGQIVTLLSINN